jgi:hypothetical protein
MLIRLNDNSEFYIEEDQWENNISDSNVSNEGTNIGSTNFTIICIYRSPSGNFTYFLNQLEAILNKIHETSNELILCGDLNINYFNDNSRKDLLNSLLAPFNLVSMVNFPTRISKNSCTLIDNIYINAYQSEFSVYPLINGLSDHDAQVITLNNIFTSVPNQVFFYTRNINNHSISKFLYILSYKNWEDVFVKQMLM